MRHHWHWYEIVILAMAWVIVFPDKLLNFISQHTNRSFDSRHLLILEVPVLVLMVIFMTLIMPVYPSLQWWFPVFLVAVLAMIRGIGKIVQAIFGFQ